MNVIDAIKERRSVRSYDGRPLGAEELRVLQQAIDESYSLFSGHVTIRIKSFDLQGEIKPGTYGVIRGASDFFLLGFGEDEDSALTAGFQFEQIVLRAWQLGLGTCWIAGTYKGSEFDQGEKWPDGESLKIICPVGYPEKQRLMEKMMRLTIGSNNRKPFSELFFEDGFKKPLNPDNKFKEPLEMLRVAPSSTNSQPWRVLVEGNKVMFYYKPKYPITVIDCGIGICHFYETEKFNGYSGHFMKETNAPVAPDDWKYLISYTRE